MHARCLTRRASLLLPLLVAACGDDDQKIYPPLRFVLPPLRLNVSDIQIEQRFMPSGVKPDVSQLAPVQPVDALRTMAQERLQAFGTTGRAVFSILDASLTRQDDIIHGMMDVRLDIYGSDDARVGFAEAQISRAHTGRVESLRGTLYDMVKAMMQSMNVEFEYQLRHNLRDWLVGTTAAPTPVQQAPLDLPTPR